ncbi:hypothetical protein [Tabrizicola oligotrophica]|uniref:Lipoprotein n=1 Tax=Tabrizicola oligotrophica TaxID=2710650 RepID=A0A6M0QPR5_9RHOB|nr:hypothetical protein [Tabrizicola oligotrophica]NEY89465.1 hypothetical protein [Tabrizicola oligotrophica]
MTGASKILTVSYGTFSCTLEGFDDPFNTMKAIAEYFRDLAAGDRYFGAEPPTPDAAMLHRIAEREIQRRVEAKIQDNGVILRAGETAAPEGLPAPAAPAPVAPTLAEADSAAEGVAARLQRIRARHASQTAAPAPQTMPIVTVQADLPTPELATPTLAETAPFTPTTAFAETYSEDEHAEDLAPAAASDATLIEIPDQIESILDEAEHVSGPVVESAAEPVVAADLSEEFAELPDAEDFELTALAVAEEAPAPETVAPAFAALVDDEALLASIAEDLDTDQLPAGNETAAFAIPAVEPVEFLADDLADAGMLDETDTAFDEEELLTRLSGLEPDVADEPADLEQILNEEVSEADPILIESVDHIEPETAVESAVVLPAVAEVASEIATETAAKAQRARARVIRIRRVEPVVEAPVAETPADSAATGPASALSDEAEAALQAELAALEAELDDIAGPDPVAGPSAPVIADVDQIAEAETVEPVADLRRHIEVPAEDEAVNRLMAHANSEMGDQETRRRQSTIAHLKAAVAVTVADRGAHDDADSEMSRMEAYRNDLDRVVRPRRPVSEGNTPRPEPIKGEAGQRPTPLVLVSAQRIDRHPATAAEATPAGGGPRVVMPVRPRRTGTASAAAETLVATEATARPLMQEIDQDDLDSDDFLAPEEAENVFAEATSFQDFADQLGATALPDLLEAAAVYCAEVLQRPEFSRPLVMRQIAGLPGQSSTAREDYLRGFGTLLRQGRIAKVKRGMFALTDRSPYLAEARKQVG